ncbi:MAG: hypothetical protein ACRCTE_10065, partial [Cellulosilyticaceae bacterium]
MRIGKILAMIGIVGSMALGSIYGIEAKEMDQLFRESVVVSIKDVNKQFTRGYYSAWELPYKMERVNGKLYMPLRVWVSILNESFPDEWWQLIVGTTEPVQIDLV